MTLAKKLQKIAENEQKVYDAGYAKGISVGGGTPTTPTDKRTDLAYWYGYLGKNYAYEVVDWDTYEYGMVGEDIEELEYPQGTQSVTSVAGFLNSYLRDDEMGTYQSFTLPVKKMAGTLDLSKSLTAASLFADARKLVDVGNILTPNVENFSNMFNNCQALTSIPEFDTSKGTDFRYMFSGCQALTSVPEIDTSNGTNFENMFRGCQALKSIHKLDTSKGSDFNNMFNGCKALTSIPEFDTSKGTNFNYMFNNCFNITTVPQIDTSKATAISYMFAYCSNLTSIPELDCRSVTVPGHVVLSCAALTSLRLKNLKTSITIASGTSYGHLIVVDDLIFMIYHLRDTGSSKTFTMGSKNLEKLANVYVRTISITDEMRVDDDFIDEKLPFEVCESDDSGAILITDYVTRKNWILK